MSHIKYFCNTVRDFKNDGDKNWASYSILIKDYINALETNSEEDVLNVLKEYFPEEENAEEITLTEGNTRNTEHIWEFGRLLWSNEYAEDTGDYNNPELTNMTEVFNDFIKDI